MKTLVTIWNPDLKANIFSQDTLNFLNSFSEVYWIQENQTMTSEELAEIIGDFDACITSWNSPKITEDVLAKAQKLKFVGHAAGTIVPYIDEKIFETDIAVVNSNSSLAKSTAEFTLALMMTGSWHIFQFNQRIKQGGWSNTKKETAMGLYQQTIGLIGYGEISRELIKHLRTFDTEILLHSKHCSREEAEQLNVKLVDLDELLQQSQIISLHNTLTPSSLGLIGDKELEWIRDGALFINTARSKIVDSAALFKHVKQGRFFAALDVFDHMPLDKDSELLHLPNVICTPHIGGIAANCRKKIGADVVHNLWRFTKGELLEQTISLEKYKRMTPL
jgi:phosphoglycerate dehydrogenase-like enzyme